MKNKEGKGKRESTNDKWNGGEELRIRKGKEKGRA